MLLTHSWLILNMELMLRVKTIAETQMIKTLRFSVINKVSLGQSNAILLVILHS